jgi:two-component system OmpR family response regulator
VSEVLATVLVVDDAPDVRMLARAVLTRARLGVHEATGGREALAAVAASPPDLVLLDVQMPDLDGWETLASLRSNPDTASIPVVLCTVKSHARDMHRGWELGCDGYLTKPFSISDLTDAVRIVLARTAQERMAHRQAMLAATAADLSARQ